MRFTQFVFGASLFLIGCKSVGEDYVRPTTEAGAVDAWNGVLDGAISREDLDPKVLAEWWKTLEDETLNALIERATEANLDLRSAAAQLRQARAQRQIAAAAGSPSLGVGSGVTRSGSDAGTGELFSLGLDASWEIDVFGGIDRGVEAADADLQAAVESRRDVLVSVLAEVALNYIDLRTFQARRELTNRNLESQEENLRIVKAKLKAGDVSQLDVDRAEANFQKTRSLIPTLSQQIQQVQNRIAVLLGLNPGSLDELLSEPRALPVPSVEVAIGVPAEVLRRRPDVRQAERSLAAETARVGVAISDLYPKFSLKGSVGLESGSTSSLFDAASQVFTIGPRMQWNLFNGGRIRAQIEVRNAVQDRALVEYERALLTALEDVQNGVTAFTQERLRYEALLKSKGSAVSAAKLAETRYRAGETDYLPVLDAERTRLSAEDELAQSDGLVLANLVKLYKALGGGWDPESAGEAAN